MGQIAALSSFRSPSHEKIMISLSFQCMLLGESHVTHARDCTATSYI